VVFNAKGVPPSSPGLARGTNAYTGETGFWNRTPTGFRPRLRDDVGHLTVLDGTPLEFEKWAIQFPR
jgi:hypothetical protein